MAGSVAGLAVTRRLKDGLLGGNFGYGVSAVMAEAVEGIDREERFRDDRDHHQAKYQGYQSDNMFGHARLSCRRAK